MPAAAFGSTASPAPGAATAAAHAPVAGFGSAALPAPVAATAAAVRDLASSPSFISTSTFASSAGPATTTD